MIKLTNLGREPFILNAELIRFPQTIIETQPRRELHLIVHNLANERLNASLTT